MNKCICFFPLGGEEKTNSSHYNDRGGDGEGEGDGGGGGGEDLEEAAECSCQCAGPG